MSALKPIKAADNLSDLRIHKIVDANNYSNLFVCKL